MNQGPRLLKRKFERFTHLNTMHTKVLLQIEWNNMLNKPAPMKTPFKFRNKIKNTLDITMTMVTILINVQS